MGWPVEGGPGSPEDSVAGCYAAHNTQPVVVDRGIVVSRGVHPGCGVAGEGHSTPDIWTGPSSSDTGPRRLMVLLTTCATKARLVRLYARTQLYIIKQR